MKLTRSRLLKGAIAATASAAAIGGAAVVYGQSATPTPRIGPPFGPFGRLGLTGQAASDVTCPITGAPMGAMIGWPAGEGAASDAVLKKLGLTADQVLAERRAGKSLAEIAQAKGVSKETLVATIVDAHKTALDAAVKAGTLTQAQADAMQSFMKERGAWMVDQTTVGPGMAGAALGLGHGPGMMGHGMGAGPFGFGRRSA
jgi:hypothetical protein